MVNWAESTICLVHAITSEPDGVLLDRLPGYEVRALGLRAAAARLQVPVADLGSVATARALADVERCPVCRSHRHRPPRLR